MTNLLRILTSAALLGLSVASAGCVDAGDSEAPDEDVEVSGSALKPGSSDPLDDELLAVINQTRQGFGLAPVRGMRCPDGFAEKWADHLAQTNQIAHQDLSQIASRCRVGWAGEIVTRGAAMTPQQAVDSWMGSPGHRSILLSPMPTGVGIGITEKADGGRYYVADLVR
jgi:uncharacterized protein YkwD